MELTERLHKHEQPPATVQNDVGPVSHPPYHRQRRGPALMPILIHFLKTSSSCDAPPIFILFKTKQRLTSAHALANLHRLKTRVSLQNILPCFQAFLIKRVQKSKHVKTKTMLRQLVKGSEGLLTTCPFNAVPGWRFHIPGHTFSWLIFSPKDNLSLAHFLRKGTVYHNRTKIHR